MTEAIKKERAASEKPFEQETQVLLATIRAQIEGSTLRQLSDERQKMADVGVVFDKKIASIQALKNQVEAAPYGTI